MSYIIIVNQLRDTISVVNNGKEILKCSTDDYEVRHRENRFLIVFSNPSLDKCTSFPEECCSVIYVDSGNGMKVKVIEEEKKPAKRNLTPDRVI